MLYTVRISRMSVVGVIIDSYHQRTNLSHEY